MGIGQYGLKDPYPYSVSKFDKGERYITCFGDGSDNITTGMYRVVKGTEDETVLHQTQEEIVQVRDGKRNERTKRRPGEYKSIRITSEETEALGTEPEMIIPLGYVKVLNEDSLMIFAGEKHQSRVNYVEIHSKEKVIRCHSESELIPIHVNTNFSQVNFDVIFREGSVGVRSLDPERVTNLKVQESNWLELARNIENLNALTVELDNNVLDLDAELMF